MLQLSPIRHELITVSSFRAQVATPTKFAVASISIHTLNGGQIPIPVLIVPKLTAPVRNSIQTHPEQFPYLQGLTLAHPITSDENFHVSVLIGADYYWQFIQDHVVRATDQQLSNPDWAIYSQAHCLYLNQLKQPVFIYLHHNRYHTEQILEHGVHRNYTPYGDLRYRFST